ncbi:MAG TPA: hypothetical protein VK698_02520 [Kofleriaceae bacterium]|nr:hypothetical protein [Kofleriaceae bacterium]
MLELDNLRAAGLGRADLALYDHPGEHLRDELYRVWLAVEAQLRRRWERGALRRDLARPGQATADEIDAVLAEVHADYGNRDPSAPGLDARDARKHLLRRAAQVDARAEATLAAGRRLPLHEIASRLGLDPDQRRLLAACAAPLLDPRLLPLLRLLTGDPAADGLTRSVALTLAAAEPIGRARLAAHLAAGSPLVDLRLVGTSARGELIPSARLLALLSGAAGIDPELTGWAELRPRAAPGQFPAGLVARAAAALGARAPLCVLVGGAAGAGKLLLVEEAAASLGRRVLAADTGALTGRDDEARTDALARLARDALLARAVLAVRHADAGTASALLSRVRAPIAIISPPPAQRWPAPTVPIAVPELDPGARAAVWQREAPELDDEAAAGLARLYNTTASAIARVVAAVRAMGPLDLERLVAEIEARLSR